MEGKFICTECKTEFEDDGQQYTSCPLCGAEMDYIEKEDNIAYINGVAQ